MKKPIVPDMPPKFREDPPSKTIELDLTDYLKLDEELDISGLVKKAKMLFPKVKQKDLIFKRSRRGISQFDPTSLSVFVRSENPDHKAKVQDYHRRKEENEKKWAEYYAAKTKHAEKIVEFEIQTLEENLKHKREHLKRLEERKENGV